MVVFVKVTKNLQLNILGPKRFSSYRRTYIGPPVLSELRLQVLVFGVEELNEVCRLRDARVGAQELITIFLQEFEAHQRPGGALLLSTALHLFV